ncbi:MAG: T9SS type A sorting domain-containing protein, partial [Bacteroidales bacterium]|nr:T9SS type A sorting domain-containing protein [Bacteroidales bacterium]
TGSGGMAFISAENIGPVDFYENTVSSSSMAGDNGGLLYLNANTSIDEFSFTGNKINNAYAGKTGGSICINGSSELNYLEILSNKINTSKSDSSGGFLYLNLDKIYLANIGCVGEGNHFSDCRTNHNGGGIFIQCFDEVSELNIVDNKFSNCYSTIYAENLGTGACLYLKNLGENQSELKIEKNDFIGNDLHSFHSDSGSIFINNYFNINLLKNTFDGLISKELAGAVCILNSSSNVSIDSCIFSSNMAGPSENENSNIGGSLYIRNCLNLNINNSKFTNNISHSKGGAVFCDQITNSIEIQKCSFLKNSVVQYSNFQLFGGSIYTSNSKINLSSNAFTFNSTESFNKGNGGGIAVENSEIYLSNNYFSFCTSRNGGGIYLSDCFGLLDSNFILNNHAHVKGGGIYIGRNEGSSESLILKSNYLLRNISFSTAGGIYSKNSKDEYIRNHIGYNKCIESPISVPGGGVFLDGYSSASRFTNCIIYRNEVGATQSCGGGIHIEPPDDPQYADSTIVENCTIIENDNYGLFRQTNSNFSISRIQIDNTIVWDNFYQVNFQDGNIYSYYSDIPGAETAEPFFNIQQHPKFVHVDSVLLQLSSPCIDRGNPAPEYFDNGPSALGSERNDIGSTGGPFAYPETTTYREFYALKKDDYFPGDFKLDSIEVLEILGCGNYNLQVYPCYNDITYTWVTEDSIFEEEQCYKDLTFSGPGYHVISVYAEKVIDDMILTAFLTDSVYVPAAPVIDSIFFYSLNSYEYIYDAVLDTIIFYFGENSDPHNAKLSFYSSRIAENNICEWIVTPSLPEDSIEYFGCNSINFVINIDDYRDSIFSIILIDSNECGVDRDTIEFFVASIVVGINNIINQPLTISYYPNPSYEFVNIKISGEIDADLIFTITDMNGREVLYKIFNKKDVNTIQKINLKFLEKGFYIGKIINPSVYRTFKLIKY